jgi:hypothetical protein
MITTLFAKFGLYALFIVGAFTGGMITSQRLQKAPVVKIPDCICPKPDPCNGIDFEKIKSKHLTIENKQYLSINGDSLLVDKIVKEIRLELQQLRLARCK